MFKVLIVEDEILVRVGLRSMINWKSLDMIVIGDACNGKQALEIYEKEMPDIILTDIKMPIMGGLELIKQIREKNKEVKIIILTCYEEFEYLHEAMKMGVTDYILKLKMNPSDIEQTLKKLKDELWNQSSRNKFQNQLYGHINKQDLIKQYLFYHQYTDDIFREKMKNLKVNLSEDNLIMARMKLRGYETAQNRLEDSQGQLTQFVIINIIEEILQKYGNGEIIQEKYENFFLLFSFAPQDCMKDTNHTIQEITNTIEEILTNIQELLFIYVDTETYFGLSRIYQEFPKLPQMYEECGWALEQSYYIVKSIYQYSDITIRNLQQEQLNKVRNLEIIMQTQYRYDISEITTGMVQLHENGQMNKTEIDKFLIQFLYRIKETHKEQIEKLEPLLILEYADHISGSGTFEEALQVVSEYCIQQARNENAQLSQEIYQAVTYIEQNLRSRLTLNCVANHVGLSPNYLSSLFKKELHISFVDFINKKRMDMAKELLVTTNYKTYQIADLTGYTDDSYFSRTFKKITGKLPSEYRRRYCKI